MPALQPNAMTNGGSRERESVWAHHGVSTKNENQKMKTIKVTELAVSWSRKAPPRVPIARADPAAPPTAQVRRLYPALVQILSFPVAGLGVNANVGVK